MRTDGRVRRDPGHDMYVEETKYFGLLPLWAGIKL